MEYKHKVKVVWLDKTTSNVHNDTANRKYILENHNYIQYVSQHQNQSISYQTSSLLDKINQALQFI